MGDIEVYQLTRMSTGRKRFVKNMNALRGRPKQPKRVKTVSGKE